MFDNVFTAQRVNQLMNQPSLVSGDTRNKTIVDVGVQRVGSVKRVRCKITTCKIEPNATKETSDQREELRRMVCVRSGTAVQGGRKGR